MAYKRFQPAQFGAVPAWRAHDRRRVAGAILVLGALGACAAAWGQASGGGVQRGGGDDRATRLTAAEYTEDGRLAFPNDTDTWIAVGSGIGGDYEEGVFDPARPGTINVVRMEPRAYEHFLEHGRYADGTMLLLTFYGVQEKPDPALRGFVQGDVRQQEIHVVDRQRFPEEGRAFFVFGPAGTSAAALPVGSECFSCHTEHGGFDATFTQFYPALRDVAAAGAAAEGGGDASE